MSVCCGVAKLLGSGLLGSQLLAASHSKNGEFPKNVPECGWTLLFHVQQIFIEHGRHYSKDSAVNKALPLWNSHSWGDKYIRMGLGTGGQRWKLGDHKEEWQDLRRT